MANVTEYGDISQRTAYWAAATMLAHAEPIIVLSRYGAMKPIPKNKAQKVKFRRWNPHAISTTPLVEGVTPAGQKLTYTDVEATLAQYGGLSFTTDVVEDQVEDPVLSNMSEAAGEQAAETIEMVTYGIIKGGTNVLYADTADTARTDVNSVVTIGNIRAAIKYLKNQRAKMITKKVGMSVKYGSEPVAPAFLAFCHTDLEPDLSDLPGFVEVEKYAGDALPHEHGKLGKVRFITSPLFESFADAGGATSTMVSTSGTNADVYPIIIIGQEAFGHVPLKGKEAIKPMVLRPNVPRGGDELGQRGSVGWKTYYTAVRLNEAWMVRIEVAATEIGTV